MGDAGRDSTGLAQQMLGWVTVPGSWHVAGQSPSVTEPEMVADEHRPCLQIVHRLLFPWGMSRAGDRSVPVQVVLYHRGIMSKSPA